MAFEQLTALTRELGTQAGRDADEAFNVQHDLDRDQHERAAAIVASVKEQHRREQLAQADGERRFVADDEPDADVVHRTAPSAVRPPAPRFDDDDEGPPSWLS